MEVTGAARIHLLQSHAHTQVISVNGALAVPGQFATLREAGGYDTRQDSAAMSRMALQGLVSMNQAMVANIR